MKPFNIFKSLFVSGLLISALQASGQTSIEHKGGFIKHLDKTYDRLETIDSFPASLTLSLDSKTNKYNLTITQEKRQPLVYEFSHLTQKEKCASLIANGKKGGTAIRFKVSGLDCKIPNPTITIRDKNLEIFFLLTEQGNLQAVSELKKVWVKKQ